MALDGPTWPKIVQYPTRAKTCQDNPESTKMIQDGPGWSKMTQDGPKSSNWIQDEPRGSKMTQDGPRLSKMTRYGSIQYVPGWPQMAQDPNGTGRCAAALLGARARALFLRSPPLAHGLCSRRSATGGAGRKADPGAPAVHARGRAPPPRLRGVPESGRLRPGAGRPRRCPARARGGAPPRATAPLLSHDPAAMRDRGLMWARAALAAGRTPNAVTAEAMLCTTSAEDWNAQL